MNAHERTQFAYKVINDFKKIEPPIVPHMPYQYIATIDHNFVITIGNINKLSFYIVDDILLVNNIIVFNHSLSSVIINNTTYPYYAIEWIKD